MPKPLFLTPYVRLRRVIVPVVLVLSTLIAPSVSSQPLSLDQTFGSAGRVLFESPGFRYSAVNRIFTQPSGRLVAVGFQEKVVPGGYTAGIAMIGMSPSGTLDSGFANGGRYTDWTSAGSHYLLDSAMLVDGRLLVLSQFNTSSAHSSRLTRFTVDGSIDTSFAADLNIHPEGTYAQRLALDDSGRIYALVGRSWDWSLIRLNANGSRDSGFGTNGVKPLNLTRLPQRYISDFRVLPSDKLLLVGQSFIPDNFDYGFFAARLDENGHFDRMFGSQGIVRLPGSGNIEGSTVLTQPDGKIVLAGCLVPLGSDLLLLRLTNRGKLDLSFGTGGIVTRQFGFSLHCANAAAFQTNGSIVIAGYVGTKAHPPNPKFLVARFSGTGNLIAHTLTDFPGNTSASSSSLSLQPDGKIVVAGYASTPGDTAFALARYNL